MISKPAMTLSEWAAQGMDAVQGQQFAQEIQEIEALKIFMRVLPTWCAKHKTGVVLQITSDPQFPGVGIEFAFSRPTLSVASANELTNQLSETSRLMELEVVVEKMRGLGVSADLINPLVDEANALALKIHTLAKSVGVG